MVLLSYVQLSGLEADVGLLLMLVVVILAFIAGFVWHPGL